MFVQANDDINYGSTVFLYILIRLTITYQLSKLQQRNRSICWLSATIAVVKH